MSDWLVIDQSMIDRFADLVNDHLFIHVDPARAAQARDLGLPGRARRRRDDLAIQALAAMAERVDGAATYTSPGRPIARHTPPGQWPGVDSGTATYRPNGIARPSS